MTDQAAVRAFGGLRRRPARQHVDQNGRPNLGGDPYAPGTADASDPARAPMGPHSRRTPGEWHQSAATGDRTCFGDPSNGGIAPGSTAVAGAAIAWRPASASSLYLGSRTARDCHSCADTAPTRRTAHQCPTRPLIKEITWHGCPPKSAEGIDVGCAFRTRRPTPKPHCYITSSMGFCRPGGLEPTPPQQD
jgi:hypothetical protein